MNKPSSSPQQGETTVVEARSLRTEASVRDRLASSPRARRTAAKLGIDWRRAKPSGRTGRIRERDVLALAAPVHSLRPLIAERMLTSHRLTAPVTLTTTIDATELVNLRKQWKIASESSAASQ